MVRAPNKLRSIESIEAQFAELDQRITESADVESPGTDAQGPRDTSRFDAKKRLTTPADDQKTPFLRLAVNDQASGDRTA